MTIEIPAAAAWIFAALSAISVGVAAGPVAWRIAGESGQPIGSVAVSPVPDGSRLDLSPILTFAPFGSVVGSDTTPQVINETGLGLTLMGVTLSIPASASRAIIGGGDSGRAESYAIGAAITANVTLAEVARTHVVLEVDDRLETLSFEKSGAKPTATGKTDLRTLIPAASAPSQAPASNDSDAVIARYRAAILQNPQSVMERLGLEATGEGYRISEAASPGVRQAGFRPGDLVTAVNGQKVGDIPSDQRYFDEVAASGKARVELQRDGETIIMTFPLR